MLTHENHSFYFRLAALSMVLVSESISSTLILPFVGLFVARLRNVTPDEAGFLSGILVSVFQLGQIITGKTWGRMSDRFGRKPMIQLGLFFNAVIAIFFGVSPSIEFCILMRFLHGCANGNVIVAKTVIADITDRTTESLGFSAITLFWGVGSIVGPTLGGLLYDPVKNPKLSHFILTENAALNFFVVHPAVLSMLVTAAFSLLALLSTCLFLPETSKNAVDPLLSLCFSRRNTNVLVVEESIEEKSTHDMEDPTFSCISEETDGPSGREEVQQGGWGSSEALFVEEDATYRAIPVEGASTVTGMRQRKLGLTLEGTNNCGNKPQSSFGYREALKSSNTQKVLIMYMCIASTEFALLEVIPLWSIASVEKGGLGLSSADVGWLMGATSVVCVIANINFTSLLRCVQNHRVIWDTSVILWALFSVATPCAIFFPRPWVFTCVAVLNAIREVALSWNFALVYIFIARSSPEEHLGSMNGIAQSLGSLSRLLTMLVLPPLFAWSLQGAHSFPFNHHFVFWLTTLPLLVSYVLSTYLSPIVLSG
ncbi:hypothetical protein MOQ_004490 [Trypanosoma cruzi marinkellei]|uniref:Major facilitator superfamily (MFS) profile domain-containing protein n=1 Tax=Trypanosoma cruzi marinkellei TaxID=85056 RepID=K2NRS3_TRYCR|nr:hypothetical protein MOQ_004490 [Trypanosoma cruzi marinkellei]